MKPQNAQELEIWWSAYLATLAGGKQGRLLAPTADQALHDYREAAKAAAENEQWSA